jgi:hypothetical protein
VTVVAGIGHSPHREARDVTLNSIADFATRILCLHEGWEGRAA